MLIILQQKPWDPIDPGTSNEPEIADVGNIADEDKSESESVSSNSPGPGINFRLRTIARDLSTKIRFGLLPESDDKNLAFLMQHMALMTWLSDLLRGSTEDSPPPTEVGPRLKGIPEMRTISWSDWTSLPRYAPDQPRYAVDILVEDPPPLGPQGMLDRPENDEDNSSAFTKLPVRPDGVPTLPTEIAIMSLPIRRIISDMADGRFRVDAIVQTMYIFRPFKILVYLEDKIRRRASELHKLFAESVTTATEQPSDEEEGGKNGDSLFKGKDLEKADAATGDDAESTRSHEQRDHQRDGHIFNHGYWNQLTRDELQEAAQDFDVLLLFMDKYMFALRNALRETDDVRVSFRELWYLYTPGTIVYVKDSGVPQKLWRVIQGVGGTTKAWGDAPPPPGAVHPNYLKLGGATRENKTPPFTLDCYYIDFDGTNYVRVIKSFTIDEFQGLTHVQGLPILPFQVAQSEGLVDTKTIRERGIEFLSYTQQSYCYFRGRSLSYEPDGHVLRRPEKGSMGSVAVLSESIESPVVVDFERCLNTLPDWKPCRVARELTVLYPDSRLPPQFIDDDRVWDLRLAEQILNYTDQTQSIEIYGHEPPSGDEILLLPDRVFAFVLRTRRWGKSPECHMHPQSHTREEVSLISDSSVYPNQSRDSKCRREQLGSNESG